MEECREAATLIDRIWGEQRIVTPALLWAMASHGGLVLGAEAGGRLVGAQMAFLGLLDGELILHSHVTGVSEETQHAGIGFALKLAQRDWCVARGIELVTWTFDPMIARNAYFNLRKLGAIATRFLPDYYGPMGDAYNAGERTDRLEVRWEVRTQRVERALAGGLPAPTTGPALLQDEDGTPVLHRDADGERLSISIPHDYLAMRSDDTERAAAWRAAAGEAFTEAMERGYRAVDLVRPATYVLER